MGLEADFLTSLRRVCTEAGASGPEGRLLRLQDDEAQRLYINGLGNITVEYDSRWADYVMRQMQLSGRPDFQVHEGLSHPVTPSDLEEGNVVVWHCGCHLAVVSCIPKDKRLIGKGVYWELSLINVGVHRSLKYLPMQHSQLDKFDLPLHRFGACVSFKGLDNELPLYPAAATRILNGAGPPF